jgi:hypothetical protein
MMIGGNISGRTNTLSLEIYNSVSRGDFDSAMKLCAMPAFAGLVLSQIHGQNLGASPKPRQGTSSMHFFFYFYLHPTGEDKKRDRGHEDGVSVRVWAESMVLNLWFEDP